MKTKHCTRTPRPWRVTVSALPLLALLSIQPAWARKPQPPPEPPPEPQLAYRMVDLGTLGGARSEGGKINNFGWVVGGAESAAGDGRAFVVIPQEAEGGGLDWFKPGANGANALMIDLGVLGGEGYRASYARGVNDLGQVVGDSTLDATEDYTTHAFLWQDLDGDRVSDPGEMLDLGTLSPGGNSRALAINNLGQVVGSSGGHGFLINPLDTNGDDAPDTWFVGQNGVNDLMIDLGGGIAEFDLDINVLGEIVGTLEGFAFLLCPVADNDGILHWYADEDSDGMNDLMVLLPVLSGAKESRALAINTQGVIMGSSRSRVMKWQLDETTREIQLSDLGGLEHEDYTIPWDLNDAGQAVGCAFTPGHGNIRPSQSSWVLENGSPVRLSDRIVDWGQCLSEYGIPFTTGINDAGEIVGWAYTASDTHAYIAIPVP